MMDMRKPRLRRAAAALDRLSAAEPDDVSDRLSVLDSWFESQTFNDAPSAARTAVVEALVRGLDHDDLRSRLIIARETLRLLDGTVLAGDGPRGATFGGVPGLEDARERPLFFDVKLVAVLLAALARAAQKLAPAARKEDRAQRRARPRAADLRRGTIKNLTNHDGHLRPLGQLGIICTLCDLLRAAVAHHRHEEKRTVDDASEKRRFDTRKKQVAQLLVQVSGALRNMCAEKSQLRQLGAARAATALAACLRPFGTRPPTRAPWRWGNREPSDALAPMPAVVLRLAFALGNLTASNDANRVVLGIDHGGALPLVAMLEKSGAAFLAGGGGDDAEQVLIKLIRLVANMSINPDVGVLVANAPGVRSLTRLLRRGRVGDRAFGNFSRDAAARRIMRDVGADEALVLLLVHTSRDVAFAAAGALVNVAADPATKGILLRDDLGGTRELVEIVRRAGLQDLALAAVACKALHNLLLEAELVDAAEDAATIAAETPGAEPDAGCTDFLAAARAPASSTRPERRGRVPRA
ncbi:hypothetical protein JL720_14365 [Aureococcus anophagefferens]|nr:hypothetical protein JL720_14365 [Aureococcus anophagefferens]